MGDPKYSLNAAAPGLVSDFLSAQMGAESIRLHLHSRSISFPHPGKKDKVTVVAPLPDHFVKTLRWFGVNTSHLTD